MLIGSVSAIWNPAISALSAGCAAAPTASAASPAEAISVTPISRTPGIEARMPAMVRNTIRKVPMRLKIASRVRRRRALRLSAIEMSLRTIIASTKDRSTATAIHPVRRGITNGANRDHTESSAGVSRAASTTPHRHEGPAGGARQPLHHQIVGLALAGPGEPAEHPKQHRVDGKAQRHADGGGDERHQRGFRPVRQGRDGAFDDVDHAAQTMLRRCGCNPRSVLNATTRRARAATDPARTVSAPRPN
ncbi:hypothetical protein ACFSTD_04815 [Novosphingobium colocasiae]